MKFKKLGIFTNGETICVEVLVELNYKFIVEFKNEHLTHYSISGYDAQGAYFKVKKLPFEEELLQFSIDEIEYWMAQI